MNGLPWSHIPISGAPVPFLTPWHLGSPSTHTESIKLLSFASMKRHLISLFFILESKHCRWLLGRKGKRGERETRREKDRERQTINVWPCGWCAVFHIGNIFLLWIYVRVNSFQFHDVIYSFFNSIRVNAHWCLQQLKKHVSVSSLYRHTTGW